MILTIVEKRSFESHWPWNILCRTILSFSRYIDEEGDWDWLTNVITGDVTTAKEALLRGKK